ncbi:tetratricopeptide repeat protein [Sphaerisporangium dianthi]|uniref:Tetratricopeptide repeat protein n=1 Tax=Sphaerisporangium dianthi TaxID=1436120 RepID=A0ABV9CIB8_9ACTN
MTAAGDFQAGPEDVQQHVHAVAGNAYGAIGADIHIFGNGTPVYLLFRYSPSRGYEPGAPAAQPSRLLDARAEVVTFSGRQDDVAALVAWREAAPRTAVRWLHGPGGQGKTRLARHFAALSDARGWLVVDAVQGTDAYPPTAGGQDLRLADLQGVLLIVDYADRWPVSYLSWLFQNRLLRQDVPVRVLLLARSAQAWPAVRGKIAKLRSGIETSTHSLAGLPEGDDVRADMFRVARDDFGAHFGAVTAEDLLAIRPPRSLRHPDFGLTLAVHMAALAAVDARARGRGLPEDMVGLTVYLLDREHENWRQLYENAAAGLSFATSDRVMSRVVFTATLVGPARREEAVRILGRVLPEVPAERTLAEHAVCYPPADPERAGVLEPLMPDRLAEDYLALTLDGHGHPDHQADPWSNEVPEKLFRPGFGEPYPAHAPRVLTFLNAAAERWPHVLDVLQTLHHDLPLREHVTLDIPAAQVAIRLAGRVLASTEDPSALADAHRDLATAYARTGRRAEAVREADQAVGILRRLSAEDPETYLFGLAAALHGLGMALDASGRTAEAVAAVEEAVAIMRRHSTSKYQYLRALAPALDDFGNLLDLVDRRDEALAVTQEAVAIRRQLTAAPAPQIREVDGFRIANVNMDKANLGDELTYLTKSLDNLGLRLGADGRPADAVVPAAEALSIRRRLAQDDPEAYLPWLAISLHNTGLWLHDVGILDEAHELVTESVAIRRRVAAVNPAVYRPELDRSQDLLHRVEEARAAWATPRGPRSEPTSLLAELDAVRATTPGRTADEAALVVYERALAIARERRHLGNEAACLVNLGSVLRRLGRGEEAVAASTRALALFQDMGDPARLARARGNLGSALRDSGRLPEAADMLRAAVADFTALEEWTDAGIALNNLAHVHLDADHPDDAEPAARKAVEIFRDRGDRRHEAEVMLTLGKTLQKQGRYEESMAVHMDNRELCEEIHDQHRFAQVLRAAGDTLWHMEMYGEAAEAYYASARSFDDLGDREGFAESTLNLGMAHRLNGDIRMAAHDLRTAADVYDTLGERYAMATALRHLGGVLRADGQPLPAATALRRSAEILRDLGRPRDEAAVLAELAVAQLQDNLYEAALATSRAALRVCRETGDRDGERRALNALALALRYLNHLDEAIMVHREELGLARDLDTSELTADALHDLGTTLRYAGRYRDSASVLRRAAAIHRQAGAREKLRLTMTNLTMTRRARLRLGGVARMLARCYARFRTVRGLRRLAAGTPTAAIRDFRIAYDTWIMARERRSEGIAVLGLATALLQAGELPEAARAGDFAAQIFHHSGDAALERRAALVHERATAEVSPPRD